FTKQFEWETLQSEKLRAAILASYALFTMIYIVAIHYIINYETPHTNEFPLPATLLFFLFALFIYEAIANRVLNYRLKKFDREAIHPDFKYLTAFFEVGFITVMLYVYSIYFKKAAVLSDVILVSLYYLIVFLSAFYLDRLICVVTGTITALAYTVINIIDLPAANSNTVIGDLMYNKYFVYGTGTLLFFTGIAAAFMANQLKKGIMRAVDLVEDEHKLFNLFSRQISREVANELMDNDGKVISQSRFVSIMFIDIRNFTVYAETQTPEDLVEFQNSFFGVIVETVNKYHGIVNQFLGDGCMITFGAPIEIENPSRNAIHSALEIKNTLEEMISKGDMHVFQIGIGIHCGDAVTGNIGTPLKSEYSITGGVVILAARIEQFNKQLGSHILVSKEAFDVSGITDVPHELATDATLKGWSHPVPLYKIA
ncbi:MAG: adenylate/guanylate cyclase domain-containing protein, partial [Ginsengibacter sp.]